MVKARLMRRLGTRVRDLRLAAKLTQEELAERAGIVPAYVSAIERATKSPTIETAAALAAALGVTLSEMLLDVDSPLPRELQRLETALAAQGPEAQRTVLGIVEGALRLCRGPARGA